MEIQTKFHPILFQTPMVQGLIENRKKLTRRTKGLEKVNENPNDWKFEAFGKNPDNEKDNRLCAYFTIKGTETWYYQICPYNVGDVFWVRETSHEIVDSETLKFISYGYKADNDYKGAKWTPSIFMPKEACRIFLKLKKIKVERLQDISEEDAKAEGVIAVRPGLWKNYLVSESYWTSPIYSFETLWISINGKESMNQNPFVWVYEFEQIEKPLDFIV